MKIESVRIQNLRAFRDQVIRLDDYTCLVGPNGTGKSTVLCALNVFFRSTEHSPTDLTILTMEDFHQKDTSTPIRVTVTFTDLSPDAQVDFRDYVRQGKLVVSAVATYDPATQNAPVKQIGERLGIGAFRVFFAKLNDGAKVPELQALFSSLRERYPELTIAKTKEAMATALHDYEAAHQEVCELIPSGDEFYGFSKGTNRLAKYVQWVYVPAVKDATSEQQESKNGALGKLLARTVRAKTNFAELIEKLRSDTQTRYQEVLDQNQSALDGISLSLKTRLADWAHPETGLRVRWQCENRSVRVDEPIAGIVAAEGEFEGELARFGHGLQRSYLLALLQELSGCDDPNGPTLLLACEEPELFQHPPQARHLANVLRRLSSGHTQVILCTHSPYFVSGQAFDNVRLARKPRGSLQARVGQATLEEVAREVASAREEQPANAIASRSKLFQELLPSLNEMFFAPVLILVEGMEDVAYLTTYLALLDLSGEFRRLGCHIVAANGKGHMIQPRAVANRLDIPTFTVFDSDGHQEDKNGSREKHRIDNLALLRLCGDSNPDPFPTSTYWGSNVVVWKSEIGDVVKNEIGPEWATLREKLAVRYGHVCGLEKNALFVGELLSEAWERQLQSESLARLCRTVLTFAERAGKSA